MIIRCLYDKLVPLEEIKPNPRNRNNHPDGQIKQLAKILNYQGWRYPVKVSKQSGYITSGHGRVLAAKQNGWKEVPINFQDYDSPDQEYLDLQADNAIAMQAEIDMAGIQEDLKDLPNIDIELLGFQDLVLDPLGTEGEDGTYSRKIEPPVYEPKGEKPSEQDLYDLTKTNELTQEIESSNIPPEIKKFLTLAAQRHIVFDYGLIAEYYAHAPEDVQNLMEKSALVIIDFNKAIENGFVKLNKLLSEAYDSDHE